MNGLGGGICDLLQNMSADGLRALDSAFFASDPANTGYPALLPQLFFFTLVTGPRSLSLKLSDTRVYEPQTRARLGTTAFASDPANTGYPIPCTLYPIW